MYHIVNHESYKGKGEHVMPQVVIFFGSVAKPKVGSNLNMPSNQWDDLSSKRGLFHGDGLMHRKFNTCQWTVVVHAWPCPHSF